MATPKPTRNTSARKSKFPTTPTSASPADDGHQPLSCRAAPPATLATETEDRLREKEEHAAVTRTRWGDLADALEVTASVARKVANHYRDVGDDLDDNLVLAIAALPGLAEEAMESVEDLAGTVDSYGLSLQAARVLERWTPGKGGGR